MDCSQFSQQDSFLGVSVLCSARSCVLARQPFQDGQILRKKGITKFVHFQSSHNSNGLAHVSRSTADTPRIQDWWYLWCKPPTSDSAQCNPTAAFTSRLRASQYPRPRCIPRDLTPTTLTSPNI